MSSPHTHTHYYLSHILLIISLLSRDNKFYIIIFRYPPFEKKFPVTRDQIPLLWASLTASKTLIYAIYKRLII